MNVSAWRQSFMLCLIVLGLVGASIAIAGGAGNGKGGGGSSSATINGEFSDECRDFDGDSSKDISHVVVYYEDGRVEKDEGKGRNSGIDGRKYSKDGGEGDEIDRVTVKSGTTSDTFYCDEDGNTTECSNNRDDDDLEDALADEDDPGCHTDGDATDGDDTYNPRDDDESDGGGGPGDTECSDDVNNDAPEDELVDEDDPGCHTDGDAGNPDSYDPTDNDESDGGGGPGDTECSDDVNNDAPEDELVDEDDPGCHTDGDAGNPDSYDPTDNDESDGGGTGPEGPPGDPTCSDGVDNDGDGLIDQDDPDCQEPEGPPGDPTCSDGIDNDGDGLVDAADPDCQQAQQGRFTCRASALRIENSPLNTVLGPKFEPIVANERDDPCATDDGSLVNETVGGATGQPGSVTVRALFAETENNADGPDSRAGVAQVIIRQGVGPAAVEVVRADVVTAEAAGSCNAAGQPVLTSSSDVVGLRVMGNRVPLPTNAHQEVVLGPLGTLHINEQTRTTAPGEEVLTQRALFLDSPVLGDVIVAEAIADFEGGNPC